MLLQVSMGVATGNVKKTKALCTGPGERACVCRPITTMCVPRKEVKSRLDTLPLGFGTVPCTQELACNDSICSTAIAKKAEALCVVNTLFIPESS